MAIDGKYGIVTTESGTIGETEPVVIFRAQDALLPELLLHYLQLCKNAGSPRHHLDLILASLDRVREWQRDNPTKIPESEGYKAN